ncbi:hypothetical protein [Breoghania sp. L-A4]|uniref:hypothetical protein n=1 Tax=Breoghania sp. L-A4 TaxID=2304600 RepID=UPI0020BD8A62|nr:hypothetical protein [Breoghania sp. L-A4]
MVHDLDWIVRMEGRADCDIRILESEWVGERLRHVTCRLDFGARRFDLTASQSGHARKRTIEVAPLGDALQAFDLTEMPTAPDADPLSRQAQSFLNLCDGQPAGVSTGAEALPVFWLAERIRGFCMRPALAAQGAT